MLLEDLWPEIVASELADKKNVHWYFMNFNIRYLSNRPIADSLSLSPSAQPD